MSTESVTGPLRVAVIGGGITGLAAAHRVTELNSGAQIALFEASDCVGGVLRTIRRDGFLIERSADNFITNVPAAINLCRRIGYESKLQNTGDDKRAFVVCRGKLREVPEGFTLMAPAKIWPMLATPILSVRGKLRMGWEYFVKKRTEASDESMEAFVRRRFGSEVFERLVQPLMGGIYTADPNDLSLAATMPRFVEMEQKYGSLIRGTRAAQKKMKGAAAPAASGARYSLFMAPREGMSDLVAAIVAKLPPGTVRCNSRVSTVELTANGKWRVAIEGQPTVEEFDRLIMAAPAPQAAKILNGAAPKLATEVGGIPQAGSAIVCVGYRLSQFSQPLEGFGFVVPRIEKRTIMSVSYSSLKYPGRAPDGMVLLRVFFGGALQPELIELSDQELLAHTQRELGELCGLSGEPVLYEVARWRQTMPQYHVGHLDRIARIRALVGDLPNFALAGNAYDGVGVPLCIQSGEQAAEKVSGPSPTPS